MDGRRARLTPQPQNKRGDPTLATVPTMTLDMVGSASHSRLATPPFALCSAIPLPSVGKAAASILTSL